MNMEHNILSSSINRKLKTMNRILFFTHSTKLSVCLCLQSFLFLLTGCNNSSNDALLRKQIVELTNQKTQLSELIDESRAENKQLKKQVQNLANLPEQAKGKNLLPLIELENVKIHRYTGIYDENEDGKIDTLIVCIQPIDKEGDVVKAVGAVDIQLWNLNKPEDQAMLDKWHVDPNELKNRWVAFLVINYRMKFDITKIVDPDTWKQEPLTVKMTFTDYLSGQVFEDQKVIKEETP
jgi:hypothetical protein